MGYIKLSVEQEKQLVADYKKGVPVKTLCARYGFATKKSITDKVKKHYPDSYKQIVKTAKENRKGYDFKLEKITNEFEAYYVGLMLTDGYVDKTGCIGIDLTDEDCIAFLSKGIGKKYSTYDKLYTSKYKDRVITQRKTKHRLILFDDILETNLARFGVVPNKTKKLTAPKLYPEEEQFIPYIIRGIIDGDGTVCPTSYGAPQFRIVTYTKEFANWLKFVLENKMYMKNLTIYKEHYLYGIGSAEKDNVLKLIALSYNKPFGMSRKYNELRETFRDYNVDFFD